VTDVAPSALAGGRSSLLCHATSVLITAAVDSLTSGVIVGQKEGQVAGGTRDVESLTGEPN